MPLNQREKERKGRGFREQQRRARRKTKTRRTAHSKSEDDHHERDRGNLTEETKPTPLLHKGKLSAEGRKNRQTIPKQKSSPQQTISRLFFFFVHLKK